MTPKPFTKTGVVNLDNPNPFQDFEIWKASDLPSPSSTKKIEWLVKNWVPARGATEIFGAPKSGKSHIILSMASAVAGVDNNWFRWDVKSHGPVIFVSDELPDQDAAARLLNRAAGGARPPDLVIVPANGKRVMILGDRKKAVHFNNEMADKIEIKEWIPRRTEFGQNLDKLIQIKMPALVVFDSATALIGGMDSPSQSGMYALASGLDKWARERETALIISAHTSQDSLMRWGLADRLSYSARTGAQGAPAGYSSMLGITKWRPGENDAAAEIVGVDPSREHVILMATAALRDGEPAANPLSPAAFVMRGGVLALAVENVNLGKGNGSQKKVERRDDNECPF